MKKLRGMVLGAYMGDTLALGPHWIYDQESIKAQWQGDQGLIAPLTAYHKDKNKGDFTHYGDQAFLLQKYLKDNSDIDEDKFYDLYSTFMKTYKGYKDVATLNTLDYIKNSRNYNEKSHSNDLGGISGVFNIIYCHYPSLEKTIEQVILRTKLTHDHENLLVRSMFLVRWTYGILRGEVPSKVLYDLKENAPDLIKSDIDKGESVLIYSAEVGLKILGQSCNSDEAFSGVIFLMLKFENDIKEALINNVYGGGDSAARGMILGGLLGAYHGENSLPVQWLMGMTNLKEIESLMDMYS